MERGLTFWMYFYAACIFVACEEQPSAFNKDAYFAHVELDSTVLLATEIAQNLSVPWDLEMGPDGWIWFTEQKGSVSRVHPDTGELKQLFQLEDIFFRKSSGLFSMALHPDFKNVPFVYLHYTVSTKDADFKDVISSRLVRYRCKEDSLISPTILIDSIPGNSFHNGSRMLVRDDNLFLCLGDSGKSNLAQNVDTNHGKILRIGLDGSIPPDNPFPDSPVWSTGHRNIQGITSVGNSIYISEHGPVSDDEINRIEKKGNYGWPDIQGEIDLESEIAYAQDSATIEPVKTWTPTIAPSGLAYFDHQDIPEWKNSLLLTSLKGRSLRVLQLNEEGMDVVSEKIFLQKALGRMRDVIVAKNGDIYLCTTNTDWHPDTQPWMYDSLPLSKGDRIIRLKRADSKLIEQLASLENPKLLKENLVPLKLETETYDFKPSDDNLAKGNQLYQKYCAACHHPDGKGSVGYIPPLVDSEWVEENKTRLVDVMLRGLNTPITVDGVPYNGEMPSYAYLKDEEIRDILNFVRVQFGNVKGNVVTADVLHQRKGL